MEKEQEILNRLDAIRQDLNNLPVTKIPDVLKVLAGMLQSTHAQYMCEFSELSKKIERFSFPPVHQKPLPVPPGRRIRCVFLVQHPASWNIYATVFEAMRKADDFDPLVVTIKHNDNRSDAKEEAHEELEKMAVPHIRFKMDDSYEGLEIIKAFAPDIIFRQTPYDELYSPGYRTYDLSFARLCYISYSFAMPRKLEESDIDLPSGHAAPYHSDLHYHRMCWRIFCESDIHLSMYAQSGIRRGTNLVHAGYPKFDNILAVAHNEPPFWPIHNSDRKRFRIIWAPHHSTAHKGPCFGVFPDVYKDFVTWMQERPDIEFVFRPHPLAYTMFVQNGGITQDEFDAFLLTLETLPNAARYDGAHYERLFAASDAMITDGVGFLAEYQILEKPILYMDSQRHAGFNDAGNLVLESANRVTNVAEARALCERLQKGEPDPMRQKQKEVLAKIFPYPGRSAERILSALRAGLAEERGERVKDKSLLPSFRG